MDLVVIKPNKFNLPSLKGCICIQEYLARVACSFLELARGGGNFPILILLRYKSGQEESEDLRLHMQAHVEVN